MIALRPLRPADAPIVQRLVGDEAVARMTARIPHPYPDGGAAQFLRELRRSDEIVRAIVRHEDARLVGCVGLVPEGAGTAEIGYWIGAPFWNRGYATAAVQAMLAGGGFRRYTAGVLPENAASARVLAKCGFRQASVRERDYPARGGRKLVHLYERVVP